MATYDAAKLISGLAGSAVTIYRLLTLAADGQYDHTGAVGRPDGVCAESVSTVGGAVPLAIPDGSIVKVQAGAAVSVGDRLVSDAVGKVVADTNPGLGGYWCGIARSAAAADGEVISMQFTVDQDQVA